MGLCVHPALARSRAGQAGIWGQARNSFPWRGPPHPLPGCPAPPLTVGGGGLWEAPPTPPASRALEWGRALVAGTGE